MNKMTLTLKGSDNYFVNEAFNVLRTNVQFCGQDIKVIEITSCHENEGKSTISLFLAVSLAEMGKKVLFIDADLRKSVIAARNTDAVASSGLSEVLTGQKTLQECVWATQYPTLSLLFSGVFPPNPVDLLNGKYFKKIIAASRDVYDYVIIDTPPIGEVIDAAAVAPACDGILLVAAGGKVHARMVRDAVDQLRKSGTPLLGIVRNFVSDKKNHYYYKKKYGKYKQYGTKYGMDDKNA